MKNRYFDDEELTYNDLCFVCYMIERVGRRLHQRGFYVASHMGYDALWHELSVAAVTHAMNHQEVEDRWVEEYDLKLGNEDVTIVSKELETRIPTTLQMGKVYARLISSVNNDDNIPENILRVYSSPVSEILDNYDTGYYYEPSYIHTREFLFG